MLITPPSGEAADGSDYLVLVVEDDAAARLLLASILKTLGHRTVTATCGREALEAVAEREPDLVLLDLGLPDMYGLDVAREIRAQYPQTQLPIIFVSGQQDPSERVRGFEAGGADFVTKPYDVAEIGSRISYQLEILGLRRELERSAQVLETRVAERTAELRELAESDPSTGRLNERGLVEHLNPWRRHESDRLILAIEIVQWETFTSWLGHIEAAAILRAFADRLAALPGCGPIGRLGSSVFVVPIAAFDHSGDALEALREELQAPLAAGSRIVQIKVAIGAVLDPTLDDDEPALVREANLALLGAKRKRRPVDLLNSGRKAELAHELTLEQDLWAAVGNGELRLLYQPLFDAEEEVAGFEALVRWAHPEHGMISPAVFIPLAERSGSIEPIGWWTITEAIRQMAAWRRAGVVDDRAHVAVNLSPVQAADSTLPRRVVDLLRDARLPAEALTIELTETAMLEQRDQVHAILAELRGLGMTVALDDFGTGASSLQLLQEMPSDVIKIDRSFVSRMSGEAQSCAIVSAAIALAHALGKRVVAEGIEQVAEVELLRSMNCDLYQGFLFSVPLDPAGVRELLARTAPAAVAAGVEAAPPKTAWLPALAARTAAAPNYEPQGSDL